MKVKLSQRGGDGGRTKAGEEIRVRRHRRISLEVVQERNGRASSPPYARRVWDWTGSALETCTHRLLQRRSFARSSGAPEM